MTESNPRLNTILIYSILLRYTHKNNKLSRAEIRDLIEKDYGISMYSSTVSRILTELLSFISTDDYIGSNKSKADILRPYLHTLHKVKTKPTEKYNKNTQLYFLDQRLTEYHVEMLIILIQSLNSLSEKEVDDISYSLAYMLPEVFRKNLTKHSSIRYKENSVFSNNLSKLKNAINRDKTVSLKFKEDNKLIKFYPYFFIFDNGYYYIIGQIIKKNIFIKKALDSYKIDSLTEITIHKKNNIKDKDKVEDCIKKNYINNNGAFLSLKFRNEYPYMLSGTPESFTLTCKENIINSAIETFGPNIKPYYFDDEDTDEKWMNISVLATKEGIIEWIIRHAPDAYVYVSKSLKNELKEKIKESQAQLAKKQNKLEKLLEFCEK